MSYQYQSSITNQKTEIMKTFATEFKNDNQGKFVYYNGTQGLTDCLLNNQIADTYEEAVQLMANRDGVPYENVEKNYQDWYYILEVKEIEDESLNDHGDEYFETFEEDGEIYFQAK